MLKKKRANSAAAITFRRFCKNKGAVVGFVVFAVILFICIFAEYVAPYGFEDMDFGAILAKPNKDHWFGTDDLGRDIFSRILYGGRYTLLVAFGSTAISCVCGMIIGAIAGYFGGTLDIAFMRLLDVIQSLPNMLLAIAIAAALGTGMDKTMIALGICGISGYARMMRASILSVRGKEYVEAARSINCRSSRIIIKHVIPNAISPIIVQVTMGIGQSMLAAASLSYVGLGIKPPNPEWGAMLSAARNYIRDYPHYVIFPGLMIMVCVLALNLVGDALRDALDPKLKN